MTTATTCSLCTSQTFQANPLRGYTLECRFCGTPQPRMARAASRLTATYTQRGTPMTAETLAQQYAAANPDQRYAVSTDGATVGQLACDGSYWPIASKTLLDTWVASPQILVNGQPIVRQWIPLDGAPSLTLDLDPETLASSYEDGL